MSDSTVMATGLHDSNGRLIHVGDKVKCKVTGNTDFHGEWSIYEVCLRGIVPVLLYVTSEKGDKLPKGYTGCALSEKYDPKRFLWGSDLASVRPYDEMIVLDDDEKAMTDTNDDQRALGCNAIVIQRPACNCGCSTGIHEDDRATGEPEAPWGLTFGSGQLDEWGYWSIPCGDCARWAEQRDGVPHNSYWPFD